MLDINEFIKKTIKKEIFNSNDIENKAARQIFSEIKTKYVDIREEITSEIQYKIIKKMLNDRNKCIEIYREAYRADLLIKEEIEANICNELLKELEKDLPKMMTEEEIREKINEIMSCNSGSNIGMIMKSFAGLNADKSLVSRIAKEVLTNK